MKRVVLQTVALLIAVGNLPAQAQVSRIFSGAAKAAGSRAESLVTVKPQQIAAAAQRASIRRAIPAQFMAMHHSLVSEGAMVGTIAWPLERQVLPSPIEVIEPAAPQTRSWLEQQQRNFKAWQLKREHAKQLALRQQIAALPQLQTEQLFRVNSLEGLLTGPVALRDIPALPYIERPGYLYRGLSLHQDGQSVRNILENGLRTDDAGDHSNYLLMALASSGRSAAAVAGKKFTNLTQAPDVALGYALRRSYTEDSFPVLVAVTGEENYGPIVQVDHDIPAEQITSLVALLRVNDQPTWCLLQWEDGAFQITPFK